ncbi:hypothetical protein CEUSTIGMA_g3527.t1 [Chlamydomonas eustigma]|uniref:Bromo domain-containing protein n=1 Tax=Chlamydomonas eustigma TaxID=1157962 RepID=A0A250WZ12_9CHLO|nr:hypothetical protein CEUSTIGMA_g3527.t1 [Chlamydomonas eustigma]|eukprot:GAX76084.1 hypothetical protein CEUSTIGMA_g3527.t1 [Chlamydomonas eustigma]
MVRMTKLSLRLDDGCIVCMGADGGAVRITTAKALELGKLTDRDANRIEQFVSTLKSIVPEANGAAIEHASMGGASKRMRMESGENFSSWVPKCKVMLEKMGRMFGQHKHVYWTPVNAAILPDYYKVVKNPKFFHFIETQLVNHKYSTPSEFYAECHLSFANCKLYNPVSDPYRILGEKVEVEFEKMWLASGLTNWTAGLDAETAEARGKRATAGMARQKFEAEKFEAPSKPKSQSQGMKGTKKSGKGEITSGGRGAASEQPITDVRKVEMGELLQSEAMAEHFEALMQLLPPEMLEGAEGEFELDFESLDETTLRKIDVFLRGIFGPPASEQAGHSPDVSMQDDDEDVSEGDLDDAEESDD